MGRNTLPLLTWDPRQALGADDGTGTNGNMLEFWGETLLGAIMFEAKFEQSWRVPYVGVPDVGREGLSSTAMLTTS